MNNLTQRESEVVSELITGKTNMQIAIALFISETCVKFHLTRIYKKLGVKNRTQAVLKATADDSQMEFPA